jgi:hypothetical protein
MPDNHVSDDDGLMTISRYCEVYDCSRAYVYTLLAKGELRGVLDGRRTKITVRSAKARAAQLRPFESKAKAA